MSVEVFFSTGQQITLCLHKVAGRSAFVERSAHHIPSPGAQLLQGERSSGSGSGSSQTRERYKTWQYRGYSFGFI